MPTPGEQFEALIAIMDRLRDPGGCPWDQKQTMESLQPYLIEEAYECLDAMERGDRDEQCDELGDLLLQIVFQSRIASEDGSFTLSDVIQAISDKMIRRHPHVFSDGSAEDAEDVLTQWEEIKRREKGDQPRSIVAGIPVSAPALQRAARLGEKVSRVGLDWDSAAAVREKVNEELGELEEAAQQGDAAQIEEELGDLLFTGGAARSPSQGRARRSAPQGDPEVYQADRTHRSELRSSGPNLGAGRRCRAALG